MIYQSVSENLKNLKDSWAALFEGIQALGHALPPDDTAGPVILNSAVALRGRLPLSDALQALASASEAVQNNTPAIQAFLASASSQGKPLSELLTRISEQAERNINEVAELDPRGFEGPANSLRGINTGVESLSAFPVLTADAGVGGGSGTLSGGGTGGAVSYRNKVELAMRELLGSVPRADDSKAVVAALTGSFSVREVDGHTEVTWQQRSFAGSSTLAGRVSGSQLSLLNRATGMVNTSLALLRGFQPLKVDYDPREVDAIRKINENELNSLLAEIGREGGPLVSKVNGLFASLLGGVADDDGHVGDLAYQFGFEEDQVITLDEEFTTTNFKTYRDTIEDFQRSWQDYLTDGGNDLGTNFLLLDRALTVSSQTVEEVFRAMDSVYVEEAARQVSYFQFGQRRVVLQDFLSWIAEFAGAQAQKQIHDGGRRGAEAILPIVTSISLELRQLIAVLSFDPGLPKALSHPRVRRPLQELATYLERVQQLAGEVANPVVRQ